ncbi:hypothetical protein CONPUDRAFT_154160 [Coniophora puteana RWD-64-598 SS2]|uniref:Uncharacterized protein n=1 Tax=Coniophora puteana (strain RWD-64-598) TaxID=741705 RepID=A0A5M3MR47_CONPW|nr:uncharacterized protein CONPUDRAFT_154160 [Coniophora puteana RWD-64-598 SS2]EIW81629.1 hypothetical protein CONPUDRAFT_154160 [Coniophora puteana RWD-64-598 SS2]
MHQNFVGDKPVDTFPAEATEKIPDEELAKREAERLKAGAGGGAGKRAGVASRDPAEHDPRASTTGGGWGDPKPTTDPVM